MIGASMELADSKVNGFILEMAVSLIVKVLWIIWALNL